jgi:uncharacterized RDD family membrane protein YckC
LTLRDAEWRGASTEALYDGVLWRRIGGYLVDVCIMLAIDAVLHVLLFILGFLTFGLSWLLLGPVTFLTVALAYDTLFVGGGEAATPGMRLFGIKARGFEGARPDYWQAFLMSALFYITAPATSFLILLVALFTQHNRCVHDLLSGITVVRRST